MNAEISAIDYDLTALTTDRDRANGVKYLSLIEDEARVTHIADDYDVRVDDLQRIVFALGATLDHDILDDDDVIYTDGGYSVIVAVEHRHLVEETISREISDEDALDAEREMAEQYDVDPDSVEDEKAIAHYRDQLALAVLKAMRAADGSGHTYPAGYPLVVLAEE
ncbi:hypothetical protein [Halopenitus persicus]|uniref:hypothetical protein n=1 Tax=Halopenitus persicus TaxID=1048396 RepID=UPI000BBAA709|nr:hypothetical protein [Halopenitus persicus]